MEDFYYTQYLLLLLTKSVRPDVIGKLIKLRSIYIRLIGLTHPFNLFMDSVTKEFFLIRFLLTELVTTK